jgi:hypothetical protein
MTYHGLEVSLTHLVILGMPQELDGTTLISQVSWVVESAIRQGAT